MLLSQLDLFGFVACEELYKGLFLCEKLGESEPFPVARGFIVEEERLEEAKKSFCKLAGTLRTKEMRLLRTKICI